MSAPRRILPLVLSALLLTVSAAVAGTTAVQPPRQVETGGFFAFKYWFAKKMVLDIDKHLKDLNIRADFCTFRQNSPAIDFSYRGAGPCLFKAFTSSMRTDAIAGTTYVWVLDASNHYRAVEIHWRPPHGGWGPLIQQVFKMRFEKKGKPQEKVPFKEFLAGDVKIIFPADGNLLESILQKAPAPLRSALSNVDSISLHMEPTGRQDGYVVYSGKAVLEEEASAEKARQETVVNLRTNVNIVLMKRPFFLEAKMRKNSTLPEIPPFPSELLP